MNPEQFKQARKAKSLSQKEMAGFLGVSYSAVTKWETGGNPVPAWVVERLTDKTGKFVLSDLLPEEVAKLEKIAASKGVSPESLIADLVRAGLKFGILALCAFHLTRSPSD